MQGRKPVYMGPPFPMPEIVHKRGMHEGYPWVVTKIPEMGACNGYVAIPEDHPWMTIEYPDNNVPFGEITFREGPWFGFDTMHPGQYWPEVISYYESLSPGLGGSFMKTVYGTPALKMTEEHVLTWVIQLCIDARDAYNEKESDSGADQEDRREEDADEAEGPGEEA